jgi:hypothetical protein
MRDRIMFAENVWDRIQLPGPALASALAAWILIACGKWVVQSIGRK